MESSLYIHIPYCARKCIYCDFFTGGAKYADWEGLTHQLLAELSARATELSDSVSTIYIGGGTPSQMPGKNLTVLMDGVKGILGDKLQKDAEITIEVNPEDVTEESAGIWKELGINRVSIGIQSFDDHILSSIGRRHTGEDAKMALGILNNRFENVSGDLIFGLPGQSTAIFERDIDTLIESVVSHISCYSLMVEEGTALYELIRQNRLHAEDEGSSEDMYRVLIRKLRDAEFEHYEISNFAKAGFRSRHNCGYWTGRPYLGIGPAAHSYDGERIRRSNPWNLKGYLKHDFTSAPFFEEEKLSDDELREEMIMLGLRTREGINLKEYSRRFGEQKKNLLLLKAATNVMSGILTLDNDMLSLSEEGIMIADSVISELF